MHDGAPYRACNTIKPACSQAIRDADPERLVLALAHAKAAAIKARLQPSEDLRILITCDQGEWIA